MTAKTILKIYEVLTKQLKSTEDSLNTLRSVGSVSTLGYYEQDAEDIRQAISDFKQTHDDDYMRMLMQAEEVKQHLKFCMEAPGANITITVSSYDGQTTSASLFDHAALVQSLYDALDYFQSEL